MLGGKCKHILSLLPTSRRIYSMINDLYLFLIKLSYQSVFNFPSIINITPNIKFVLAVGINNPICQLLHLDRPRNSLHVFKSLLAMVPLLIAN